MRNPTYLGVASALAGSGVVFAGYLSGVELTRGTCAFDEPCPLFLGQPACFTGFALFLAMLVPSVTALVARTRASWPATWNLVVAGVGVLFAGRLTLVELAARTRLPRYAMGLPTCAWGLLFFVGIGLVSAIALGGRARRPLSRPRRPEPQAA